MKKLLLTIAISLLASSAYSEDLDIYQFELENYPVTEESCEAVASELGEHVAAMTGVRVVETECYDTSSAFEKGMDIVVHYVSDSPFYPTDKITVPIAYDSQEECDEDLLAQKELFMQQTGLEIISAYCSMAGKLYLKELGSSDVKKWVFKSNIMGKFAMSNVWIEEREAAENAIFDAISRETDAVLAAVRIKGDNVSIVYYSESRLYIEFVSQSSYSSASDCKEEMSRVTGMFPLFRSRVIFQLCASTESFPQPAKALTNLLLSPRGTTFFSSYLQETPGKYSSLDECRDATAEKIDLYENVLGYEVYYAICTLRNRDDKYRINIYGRK